MIKSAAFYENNKKTSERLDPGRFLFQAKQEWSPTEKAIYWAWQKWR
jgi:hypothetical protein